jgi:hypothetical protein
MADWRREDRDTIKALNIPTFFFAHTIYALATFFLDALPRQSITNVEPSIKVKKRLENGCEINVMEKNLLNFFTFYWINFDKNDNY